MRTLFIGYVAGLGLAIGSFLNVVIYRVPRRESIVAPHSYCPRCQATLTWWENIPLVSYLLLRGRCRHCGERISWRYPLVELLGGALFGLAAWHFGFTWNLPLYGVVFAGLLALSATDVAELIVPKRIVYPTLFAESALLLVAAIATHQWGHFLAAVASALGWFLLFFALNFASPRLLGFGDVRLAPILGLALGWLGVGYVFWGFFAGNLIGAIVGVGLIVTKKMKRDQRFPYAVFLAAGVVVAVFTGHLFAGRLRGF